MSRATNRYSSLSIHFFQRMLVVFGSAWTLKVWKTGKPPLAIIFLLCVDFFPKIDLYTRARHENLRRQNLMSKARLAGNKEKNGTQSDVNSSLPEAGLTYSPAISFFFFFFFSDLRVYCPASCQGLLRVSAFSKDYFYLFYFNFSYPQLWPNRQGL